MNWRAFAAILVLVVWAAQVVYTPFSAIEPLTQQAALMGAGRTALLVFTVGGVMYVGWWLVAGTKAIGEFVTFIRARLKRRRVRRNRPRREE